MFSRKVAAPKKGTPSVVSTVGVESEVAAIEHEVPEVAAPVATEVATVVSTDTIKINVSAPFWINGVKYGPGICEVPADSFHTYKSVLTKE